MYFCVFVFVPAGRPSVRPVHVVQRARDAKGIMQLISHCEPRNVMLVHGEGAKMQFLQNKIKQEFGGWFAFIAFVFWYIIYLFLLFFK